MKLYDFSYSWLKNMISLLTWLLAYTKRQKKGMLVCLCVCACGGACVDACVCVCVWGACM